MVKNYLIIELGKYISNIINVFFRPHYIWTRKSYDNGERQKIQSFGNEPIQPVSGLHTWRFLF